MAVVGLACSSSSSSSPVRVYCAQSAWSCRCTTSDFTLEPWETAVPDCNSLPAGSVCCSDLDAAGNSTACECQEFVCAMGANCSCSYFSYGAHPTVVSACNQNGDETCCQDTSGGCTCSPASEYPPSYCTAMKGTVLSTRPNTPSAAATQGIGCTQLYNGAGASGRQAPSCGGLRWAAPMTGGGGGGSGGSNCKGSGASCSSSAVCCDVCNMDPNSSFYHTCE